MRINKLHILCVVCISSLMLIYNLNSRDQLHQISDNQRTISNSKEYITSRTKDDYFVSSPPERHITAEELIHESSPVLSKPDKNLSCVLSLKDKAIESKILAIARSYESKLVVKSILVKAASKFEVNSAKVILRIPTDKEILALKNQLAEISSNAQSPNTTQLDIDNFVNEIITRFTDFDTKFPFKVIRGTSYLNDVDNVNAIDYLEYRIVDYKVVLNENGDEATIEFGFHVISNSAEYAAWRFAHLFSIIDQ